MAKGQKDIQNRFPRKFYPEMPPKKTKVIAKKDWLIVHNEYRFMIKKGEELPEIPGQFMESLKAEGVI